MKIGKDGYDKKYDRGIRKEIMELLISAGCVSYDGLHSLEDDHEHRIYSRTIQKMIEEKSVCLVKYGNKKIVKLLGNPNRRYYKNESGINYYSRYSLVYAEGSSRYLSDRQSCKRALLHSEVLMFMYGAGLNATYDNKAMIMSGEPLPDIGAYYYTSLEVKNTSGYSAVVGITNDGKKVSNTRSFGMVISPCADYVVYDIDTALIRWSEISETQFAFSCGMMLSRLREHNKGIVNSCIVLYKGNSAIKRAFEATGNKSSKTFISAETGYKETYYIPYSSEGRALIRMMVSDNWKERLKEYYLTEYDTNTGSLSVVCDGVKTKNGKEYALLYCIPDITRLYRFLKAAEINPARYIIYCYEYQVSFLKSVVDGLAEVYATEIDETVVY